MSGPRPPWQSGPPPAGLLPRPQVAGPVSQQRPLINASKCGDRPLRKTVPEDRRCVFSASGSGPGLPWSGARGPPPAPGAAWLPLRGAEAEGSRGAPESARGRRRPPRPPEDPHVSEGRGSEVSAGSGRGLSRERRAAQMPRGEGSPRPRPPCFLGPRNRPPRGHRLGDPKNAAGSPRPPPRPAPAPALPRTPDLTSGASTADQRTELRLPPGQGVGSRPGAGPWRVGAGRAQGPAPARPHPPNPGGRTLDPGRGPPAIPPSLPGLAPGLFLRRAPSLRPQLNLRRFPLNSGVKLDVPV